MRLAKATGKSAFGVVRFGCPDHARMVGEGSTSDLLRVRSPPPRDFPSPTVGQRLVPLTFR